MSATVHGGVGGGGWSLSRDKEGHRTYKLKTKVRTTSRYDGPQTVMYTPGLPMAGSFWNLGNDLDPWAFCTPQMSVDTLGAQAEPGFYWMVGQTFTTKPANRCQTTNIEDPLLEPPKLSGGFVKYTQEAGKGYSTLAKAAEGGDRDKPLSTYTGEGLRGANMDANRPNVRIEQNLASLNLETLAEMVDTLNDNTLWGLAKRKVKLSNASWTRKLYGVCFFYYTRVLDFDINFETFDLVEPSYGKLALGKIADDGKTWTQPDGYDGSSPRHFNRYKDETGENSETFHDADGKPVADTDAADVDIIHYKESDLLILGIPTVLDL